VDLPEKLAADPTFFSTNVAAVVAKKLEKDKTLSAESQRLWGEIVTHREQFDRVEREVAALRALDQQQVLAFIDRYISMAPAEGESRRAKLNIQIFGNKHPLLPEVVLRDTEERAAFANLPLPSEKVETAAATGAADEPAPTPAEESPVAGEAADASSPPPPAAKADAFLPRVPIDPREIVQLDDLTEFKRTMPLFPAFQ
jgi:hypothetical protein